ncbi:pantoate--beta-alanine ligase [Methylotenera sp.]|uniref:pantoate--beta-alanine ligase n=1 Tax=Methylotenera sp. TaxID=2051956 RepID=UPI002489C30D|nr:pantoate--beta-alanine ligase [Methylotenera sp.]MDI1297758.1 pantoate--beta-alanine ligase [Methylotenera sp.]
MQIINTIADLRSALKNQENIAFVPTMGNLHAGHIQLVEVAKQHASCVVVSIFVNPLQFGPTEDLASYPRTLEADRKKLKAADTSIVFTPTVEEMYADFDGKNLNQTMTIIPPPIANELCGAARPGHFAGVATVVMKLFNMVQPSVAVFGQKDFQQLFIIKQMVKQFNLPVNIIGVDTVREPGGLAMSSRNGYLTNAQRATASQLNRALQGIVQSVKNGNRDYSQLEQQAKSTLNSQGWTSDYISIRSSLTLLTASNADTDLVVLGSAKLGNTRLIDNLTFNI